MNVTCFIYNPNDAHVGLVKRFKYLGNTYHVDILIVCSYKAELILAVGCFKTLGWAGKGCFGPLAKVRNGAASLAGLAGRSWNCAGILTHLHCFLATLVPSDMPRSL
jgi:hypothetical protein